MNNSEIIKEMFSQLSPEAQERVMASAIVGKTKATARTKKGSINGAPVTLEGVKVTEEGGFLHFKHPDFKAGRKSGYAIADLKVARELFETEQISSVNKVTGTQYVSVEGKPYGKNLVELATAWLN